jgi:hypothetical protein
MKLRVLSPRDAAYAARPACGSVAASLIVLASFIGCDDSSTSPPEPPSTLSTIYVANGSGIVAFNSSANGNVAPIALIKGQNTGISFSTGVAVSGSGRIHVTNGTFGIGITIYLSDASGDVAPVDTCP